MKLTKEKLQQIIKEELETFVSEEAEGSAHAGVRDLLKKAYKMAKVMHPSRKDIVSDGFRERMIQAISDGAFGGVGPVDRKDVEEIEREVYEKMHGGSLEEESENSLKEAESFPEDKYKELQKLKLQVRLPRDIKDDIGDEGYKKLVSLKNKYDEMMATIPKDEMTTDDRGDPQSKRYIEAMKITKDAIDLFKGTKKATSIVRNMIHDFMIGDSPGPQELESMMKKLTDLSGEFEERGSTDDQDRYYGRTSTTVTHKPSGTSKKILSNRGSLGT